LFQGFKFEKTNVLVFIGTDAYFIGSLFFCTLNDNCTTFFRMKEQLIRELVKTGKDAEQMNKQYAEKVQALEKVLSWPSILKTFLKDNKTIDK